MEWLSRSVWRACWNMCKKNRDWITSRFRCVLLWPNLCTCPFCGCGQSPQYVVTCLHHPNRESTWGIREHQKTALFVSQFQASSMFSLEDWRGGLTRHELRAVRETPEVIVHRHGTRFPTKPSGSERTEPADRLEALLSGWPWLLGATDQKQMLVSGSFFIFLQEHLSSGLRHFDPCHIRTPQKNLEHLASRVASVHLQLFGDPCQWCNYILCDHKHLL